MSVSVKMEVTAVVAVPIPHRVVAKNHFAFWPDQSSHLIDTGPWQPLDGLTIVVSNDEPLYPVQFFENGSCIIERHIIASKIT